MSAFRRCVDDREKMVGRASADLFCGEHFFFWPAVCVFPWTFLASVGYCSAVPLCLGAESDRAPCPAPVTCVCHLSTHNISRFFPSPMQASPPPPQKVSFGRSGRLFYLVCSPAHLHDCLRLSVLHAPPPCPMFANVSLFFFCYPAPNGPSLGSVGGFNHCFWVSLGLPCEGPTPLSSPPYPSITFPPREITSFLPPSFVIYDF